MYWHAGTLIPGVRKIAVVRANGIGDYIFALPALAALRQTYPNAEIVLLGLDWHAKFLAQRPGPVDRVVVVPPVAGVGRPETYVNQPQQLESFFRAMQAEQFDLAVQLHGGGRYSNPFVKHLGARVTVGLKTADAVLLDRTLPYLYFQNEVLRFLETVSLAGAQGNLLEPRLEVTAQDLAECAEPLHLAEQRPIAVLHPGAGDRRRRWPVEKFAAVGDALASAGAQVFINGNPSEQPLAEALQEAMRQPAVSLAGKLSLNGLAGLLSQAKILIGNDSGPLHVARAVGTPTVGIYWCGNLINAGSVTQARHRQFGAWRLHCPVCGQHMIDNPCSHEVSFVTDVPLEEVRDAALELYQGAHSR